MLPLSCIIQSLDIQYTVGLATDVPVEFLSVGPETDIMHGFLDAANYFLDQSTVPTVMTTSYGFDEDTVPKTLAKLVSHWTLFAREADLFYAAARCVRLTQRWVLVAHLFCLGLEMVE